MQKPSPKYDALILVNSFILTELTERYGQTPVPTSTVPEDVLRQYKKLGIHVVEKMPPRVQRWITLWIQTVFDWRTAERKFFRFEVTNVVELQRNRRLAIPPQIMVEGADEALLLGVLKQTTHSMMAAEVALTYPRLWGEHRHVEVDQWGNVVYSDRKRQIPLEVIQPGISGGRRRIT